MGVILVMLGALGAMAIFASAAFSLLGMLEDYFENRKK